MLLGSLSFQLKLTRLSVGKAAILSDSSLPPEGEGHCCYPKVSLLSPLLCQYTDALVGGQLLIISLIAHLESPET